MQSKVPLVRLPEAYQNDLLEWLQRSLPSLDRDNRLLPKRAIVFMDFVADIFEKNPGFKVYNAMK
jgi:hypothetical protein